MTNNKEEDNYLELLTQVACTGHTKADRTGVGSRSIFGASLRFDLSQGFPLMTSRKLSFRIPFEETMFFLRGETDTKKLEEKKINIWHGNTTRDFLDKRGLTSLPEGDMGKGYSWQLRNFGGIREKPAAAMSKEEAVTGVDQLKNLIDGIKTDPNSRRHLFSYWNPQQVDEAALPPCHLLYNCQILDGKLNGLFYMRSSDLYHGLWANIAGYAFLTCWLAKITGYEPGVLVYSAADAHIYLSQLDAVAEQTAREPKAFPKLRFKKDFSTLEEGLAITYEDVEIVGYQHCGAIKKVEMAI